MVGLVTVWLIAATVALLMLTRAVGRLRRGQKEGFANMSKEMDALTIEVQETTTIEESAIVLLNGLAAQIAALKTDPAALQALADSLNAKGNELAAAVTANTPVEPPPVEPTL